MLTDEQIIAAIAPLYAERRVAQLALATSRDEYRAIESAATEPLLQRIAELERHNAALIKRRQFDVKDIKEGIAQLVELERQLEEARTVLKETGLLLHHFWCNVHMSDYSFARLSDGMEAVNAAMQKGQS